MDVRSVNLLAATIAVLLCVFCLSNQAFAQEQPRVTVRTENVRDGFLKTLQLKRKTTAKLNILLRTTRYCHNQTGIIIEVPAGFVTDFASIPWWGTWFQGRDVDIGDAAIIHDWLYAVGKPGDFQSGGGREFADHVFLSYMLDLGVSEWRAKSLYRAVRTGGAGSFAKCQASDNCYDWLFADGDQRTVVAAPFTKSIAREKIGLERDVGCRSEDWQRNSPVIHQRIKNNYRR